MDTRTWRKRPVVFEIATWVWLDELQEWDALADLCVDAVWLMGVWERSPAGVAVANANADLLAEFGRVLPDYRREDNVGSGYCVRDYMVAAHLCGPDALGRARAELNVRGLRLVLDFVPNHVAIDHPWALQHPEYFIRGSYEDLARALEDFVDVQGQVYAHGRDPYFPPWRDVIQVNAFNTGLRAAAIATVISIATQCDGMRCDMAMPMLNDVFERSADSCTAGVRRRHHAKKEQDHDGFPEDRLLSFHRTSGSARSRQPVRPRLSGQRASLRAAAWISGQLAHL